MDRRLCDAPYARAQKRGLRLDPAYRLLSRQPRRRGRSMASDRCGRAVQGRACRCHAARDRDYHPDLCEQAARVFACRRNHYRFLRIKEKPR